jgi:rhodanese-related sulfurtransferase
MASSHPPAPRRWRKPLAYAALALGALALAAGEPRATGFAELEALARALEEDAAVNALDLADWLRARRQDLRVIDVRDAASYAAFHLPGAEHVPPAALSAFRSTAGETVVVYHDDDARAGAARLLLRAARNDRVLVLRGGTAAWLHEVLDPVLSADAGPADSLTYRRAVELSRYFGGVPGEAAGITAPVSAARDAAATLGRLRRRGCGFD